MTRVVEHDLDLKPPHVCAEAFLFLAEGHWCRRKRDEVHGGRGNPPPTVWRGRQGYERRGRTHFLACCVSERLTFLKERFRHTKQHNLHYVDLSGGRQGIEAQRHPGPLLDGVLQAWSNPRPLTTHLSASAIVVALDATTQPPLRPCLDSRSDRVVRSTGETP